MQLTEAVFLAALLTACLTVVFGLVLLAESAAWILWQPREDTPRPIPRRLLGVLREDYRGRHGRNPPALGG